MFCRASVSLLPLLNDELTLYVRTLEPYDPKFEDYLFN